MHRLASVTRRNPTSLRFFTSRVSEPARSRSFFLAAGAAGAISVAGIWHFPAETKEACVTPDDKMNLVCLETARSKSYPIISLKKVQDNDEGTWVTFRGGVYDVTEFMDAHPGGPHRIAMVAGGDLKGFWEVYSLHTEREHILKLLEQYRIGSLTAEDRAEAERLSSFASAYENDPARDKASKFHVPSVRPWNSEPPLETLVDSFYTPNDEFFIRNHNAVPLLEEKDYELEIESCEEVGLVGRTFTLSQLKQLPKVDVVATLQCAGNRQQDFVHGGRPLYVAPHWNNTAIGCAKWTGVRVRDVLKACGMDVDSIALGLKSVKSIRMINFIAEDTDETGVPYAGTLPIGKITDPFGDAILAYEMNGETLPVDHGFPARLLAPGHAGCRNVKWVRQIVLSQAASKLDSGSKLDRHFSPQYSFIDHIRHGDEHVRLDQGPVIQTLPVQSVLCKVEAVDTARPNAPSKSYTRTNTPMSFGQNGEASANIVGEITASGGEVDAISLAGVAWSGGGRGICRVEVSIDGGGSFMSAELLEDDAHRTEDALHGGPESGQGKHWAWTHYRQLVPLTEEMRQKLRSNQDVKLDIAVKAIDGDLNSQPEHMTSTWNVLGICPNHWSRADVVLKAN